MGGTGFIGRHVVNALLSAGHIVTVFDRGRRGAAPAAAIHIMGDRDTDLTRLRDGHWDATVDLSAYVPRQVNQLADELGTRGGTYVLMSSTAVYASPQEYGFRENAPQVVLADSTTEDVNWDTYGGLKSLCETVASERFPTRLVIRPTYVVGPYDFTGRFTYWVERIARGGKVLAPGPYDESFQFIDVQDLASWISELLLKGTTGTYQAAKPFPPVKFGAVLDEIATCVAPPKTQLVWVDRSFLLGAGLDGDSLPLWPGANPAGVIEAADPSLALSSNLKTRSLSDTVRRIHEHEVATPTRVDSPVGLTSEQEIGLLKQWHQQTG
jgi:2'-hydroxyisoflavone reductase